MNVRVASRVAHQLKTYDLRELGTLKKIPEMSRFDGGYHRRPPKSRILTFFNGRNKNTGKKKFQRF